jgi:hypothetical protein
LDDCDAGFVNHELGSGNPAYITSHNGTNAIAALAGFAISTRLPTAKRALKGRACHADSFSDVLT